MKKARIILAALLITVLVMSVASVSAQVNMTLDLEAEIKLSGSTPATTDSYTVQMKGQDGAPMPEGATDGVITVSRKGIGNIALPTLTFSKMGIYKYEIRQIPGSHPSAIRYDKTKYKVEVYILRDAAAPVVNIYDTDGEKVDEIIFINKYAETSLTVKKVWDDNDNKNKKRPASLKVTLKADGKTVQTVTLNTDNGWSATIKELPVYRDGEKIKYTWVEETITGYELTSTKISDDGLITTLTNKEKGGGTPTPPPDDLGMGMYINVGDCIE